MSLKTQNFSYDSLSISETSYRLGFFGVYDSTDTIDDNFIVSNLDFLIDSSAYYPSNNDYSDYLKLITLMIKYDVINYFSIKNWSNLS